MGHEYSHLVAFATPEEQRLYALAAIVDKDVANPNYIPRTEPPEPVQMRQGTAAQGTADHPGIAGNGNDRMTKYYARQYASKNIEEDGAVHLGEEMLAPQSDRLVSLSENAPVRTVVMSRALIKVMSEAGRGERSVHAGSFWNRIRYVNDNTFPEATRLLEVRLKSGSPREKAAAAELLGYVGNRERHTNLLRKLASDPDAALIPEDMPAELATAWYSGSKPGTGTGIAGKGITGKAIAGNGTGGVGITGNGAEGLSILPPTRARSMQDIAFDAILRLHEGSSANQFALLVGAARPQSPLRQLAKDRLSRVDDPAAHSYRKLASMAGDADRIPDLLALMDRMPDGAGKRLVFDEVMELGKTSPDFQRSLIAKALDMPELSDRALGLMKPEDVGPVRDRLLRLARQSWNKPAQEKAQELLARSQTEHDVTVTTALLRSRESRRVEHGIASVKAAAHPDHRLIEPLLEVVANRSGAERADALSALSRFSPQMVKHYVQRLAQAGTRFEPAVMRQINDRRSASGG
jgi:hypothetical protein